MIYAQYAPLPFGSLNKCQIVKSMLSSSYTSSSFWVFHLYRLAAAWLGLMGFLVPIERSNDETGGAELGLG